MHQATTEASSLRRQLDAIFNDPQLGPLAKAKVTPTPGTPGAVPAVPAVGDDPRYVRAFEEYQKAPNDQAAFIHLMKTASELGRDGALSAVEAREIEQANQARQHETNVSVATAINDAVTKDAPDVDLEIFWSFGRRAQQETPRQLTSRSERIEWQKTRMVELARAKQQGLIGPAVKAALEAEQLKTTAGVITPGGGGTPPPAAPGAPSKPKTTIEVIREMRRGQVV